MEQLAGDQDFVYMFNTQDTNTHIQELLYFASADHELCHESEQHLLTSVSADYSEHL